MEFWGAEVKSGESVKYDAEEDKLLHLSQASLGELKGKENVTVHVKVNDKKFVIGTLSAEKCAQLQFDLVFDKDFELSHTSKNTSVHFCGYKSALPEESDNEEFSEGESDEEEVPVAQNANGKPVAKQEQGKSGVGKANAVKEDNSVAKKAKKAEPAKVNKPKVEDEDEDDDEDDEDDSDEESDDDEDLTAAMSDSDDEGDTDEDESSEEEDDATPKKATTGKRPAESASKTPVPEKKAKVVTPAKGQKSGGDGKKNVHIATPHPAKQAGKTPGNSDKSKQKSPKSAGSVTCKSCNRTFNSDTALESHTKAKHG